MLKERYKFMQIAGDPLEGYPDNSILTYEFDGECTYDKLVEAFRHFSLGCGFSEQTIDEFLKENK